MVTQVGVTHTHTHTHRIQRVHWCFVLCAGDLIVSYRTDAEIAGHGFRIYVAKDMAMVHGGNCAQLQELQFEVKDMPHLYRCPLLTHDQLVAHVARFADEVEQTITRARGKDPFLRTRMFLPPQPQCVSPCMHQLTQHIAHADLYTACPRTSACAVWANRKK